MYTSKTSPSTPYSVPESENPVFLDIVKTLLLFFCIWNVIYPLGVPQIADQPTAICDTGELLGVLEGVILMVGDTLGDTDGEIEGVILIVGVGVNDTPGDAGGEVDIVTVGVILIVGVLVGETDGVTLIVGVTEGVTLGVTLIVGVCVGVRDGVTVAVGVLLGGVQFPPTVITAPLELIWNEYVSPPPLSFKPIHKSPPLAGVLG
jgi:hypothetical protein